jgi:hypothetical protein
MIAANTPHQGVLTSRLDMSRDMIALLSAMRRRLLCARIKNGTMNFAAMNFSFRSQNFQHLRNYYIAIHQTGLRMNGIQS